MNLESPEGEVLLINKPLTWTSFDVVNKVRWLSKAKKVGHAGTLDPLATGLLILCSGKKTKTIEITHLSKSSGNVQRRQKFPRQFARRWGGSIRGFSLLQLDAESRRGESSRDGSCWQRMAKKERRPNHTQLLPKSMLARPRGIWVGTAPYRRADLSTCEPRVRTYVTMKFTYPIYLGSSFERFACR